MVTRVRKNRLLTLADDLTRILSCGEKNRGRFSHVHFIVNTVAGGVARARRFLDATEVVRRWTQRLRPADQGSSITHSVHLTERAGHASQIAGRILDTPEVQGRLIVSIGGDGTHREVFTAVAERIGDDLGPDVSQVCMFRMPMGTGNDGADAASVESACSTLYSGVPAMCAGMVRVIPTGMAPMFAFNVTSIGIDAYVTDTSNRLKNAFPGDMYKLVADVATLFYEPVFGVGEVDLTLTDDQGKEQRHRDRYILVAVGPTGSRVYGNGKRILPSDDNLCAIRTVNVFRKIAMKKHVYDGTHVGFATTLSARVRKVVVDYARRVPLQLDGEGIWLSPENFPLTFERIDCAINVLTQTEHATPQLS